MRRQTWQYRNVVSQPTKTDGFPCWSARPEYYGRKAAGNGKAVILLLEAARPMVAAPRANSNGDQPWPVPIVERQMPLY
jgi:hypothetical protein